MKQTRLLLLAIVPVFVIGFLTTISDVSAQGAFSYEALEAIPGSDRTGEISPYLHAIYRFALWAVGIAAFFMLVIGGMMYLTSAGNTSTLNTAKKVIFDALIGLGLALAAWLILYVINPQLVEVNLDIFTVGANVSEVAAPINQTDTRYGSLPGVGDGSYPTTAGADWPSDATEREKLAAAGISINKPNCETVGDPSCTSLYGIPDSALNALIALKQAAGTSFTLTGGTEYWLHGNRKTDSSNKTKHTPGNGVVDIRMGGSVDTYIRSHDILCKSRQYPIYAVPMGSTVGYFWDEPSSEKHWHVSIGTSLCSDNGSEGSW